MEKKFKESEYNSAEQKSDRILENNQKISSNSVTIIFFLIYTKKF
jgi:hypothetical protein